jgi:DNA-binding LytR/AlgR family response regulator
MLRTVLVDDEPLALDALEFALDKNEKIEIVGKYTDPMKALKKIKKSRPELVFLDIKMPELDGFSVAQEIIDMGLDTNIVFATVFEEYAIKAFELDATDYVVKPFTENRLNMTVDRIAKRVEACLPPASSVKDFIRHNLSGQAINKIAVWRENSIVLLDPKIISYFSMEEKKVIVHTRDDAYETGSSLAELEERLEDKGFFRCHKSFLINMDHVARIFPWFHSTYMIKLKESPDQIPVSRHYMKKLRGMLNI